MCIYKILIVCPKMLIFRSKLIPKLLEPQSKNSDALFTDELFKEFIVPQVE